MFFLVDTLLGKIHVQVAYSCEMNILKPFQVFGVIPAVAC